MREFSSFHASFWTGETGKKLHGNLPAQILAAYLFTCRHGNLIGLYYLPLGYASHETGLSREDVDIAMKKLSDPEMRFAYYDASSEHVWVVSMAQRQISTSPKAMSGALKLLANSPKGWLRDALIRRYGQNLERLKTPCDDFLHHTLNPVVDRVPIPYPENSQEKTPDTTPDTTPESVPGAGAPDTPVEDDPGDEPPTPVSEADGMSTGRFVWLAYAMRYAEARAGGKPGRNEKTEGNLKRISAFLDDRARTGPELERVTKRLLDGFFADPWAQKTAYPLTALAGEPDKYFNPPPPPTGLRHARASPSPGTTGKDFEDEEDESVQIARMNRGKH